MQNWWIFNDKVLRIEIQVIPDHADHIFPLIIWWTLFDKDWILPLSVENKEDKWGKAFIQNLTQCFI